ERGRIWTERYVLDPELKTVDEFGRADGVDVGNPPEIGQAAATRDGLLLFGASSGLLMIDPSRFHRWDYEPPLVLTELRVDGAARPAAAVASGLRLEPRHKDFAVEVASLDFSAAQRNRYRSRLEGYAEGWTESDSAHRAW